jgi:uncharacterized membrane protein
MVGAVLYLLGCWIVLIVTWAILEGAVKMVGAVLYLLGCWIVLIVTWAILEGAV